MALYVNTNVTSLRGQSSLNKATNALATTYNRLSTGLRINSAKDDAAGLQISDRLTSQINGLKQGNRNANDGIALTQTVEGAMDEMTTMLQRIRTLSVQAANGTNTSSDRTSIQAEVTALSQEITRIACRTTFGGKKVLSGFGTTDSLMTALNGKIKFQVGSNHNDTQTLDMNFYEDDKSSTIKKKKDDKDEDVNVFTDKTPDKATEDEKKIAAKGYSLENLMRAVGLNTPAEKTAKSTSASFYVDDAGLKGTKDSGYAVFDVRTSTAAQATLASIDKVINLIDTKRGDFGALENRMSSTISNQTNIMNNESDARSRIRDTDYAEEASNLSAQSIVQQAASSMLTQANSLPQMALSLLG